MTDIKCEIDNVEEVKQLTADDRGRVALGSDYENKSVTVAIVTNDD